MSDIDQKIEEMATAMEKSTQEPKEKLFKTILELGPEGLKEKLMAKSEDGSPLLSEKDRTLLKSALEDMKKAVSMDDEYQAKYVEGDIEDTKLQEDKADDNEDEELVKPQAAAHNHQGDATPEGREGQVIKAKDQADVSEDSKTDADEVDVKEKTKKQDHKKQGAKEKYEDEESKEVKKKKMKKSTEEKIEEIKKAGGKKQLISKMCEKGYKKADIMKKMAKNGDEEKEVSEMIDQAMEEHNRTMHSGQVKKAKSVDAYVQDIMTDKKGVDDVIKEAPDEMKDDILAKLRDKKKSVKKSEDEESVEKGKMKQEMLNSQMKARKAGEYEIDGVGQGGQINKEEDQLSDTDEATEGETRGDKKRPKELKTAQDNKAAQEKVNDTGQGKVKKSIPWADDKYLLHAGRGGQNTHFNMNGYMDQVLAKTQEQENSEEDLKKSDGEEGEKQKDLNDLIAEGMTKSWYDVEKELAEEEVKKSQNGKLTKSFQDNEIARALGLTDEEAKKILGE